MFPLFTETSHSHLDEVTRVTEVLLHGHVGKFDGANGGAWHICTRAELLGAEDDGLLVDLFTAIVLLHSAAPSPVALSIPITVSAGGVAAARRARSRTGTTSLPPIILPLVPELGELLSDLQVSRMQLTFEMHSQTLVSVTS